MLRIRSIFFRIRIRGSGFKNSDPDPGDPKEAESDRIRIRILLDMCLMFSKINHFLWYFDTKSEHLMTIKIKDKKLILTKLLLRQFYITRKVELQGSFCVWRIRSQYFLGSGSGWSNKTGSDRIRIRNTEYNNKDVVLWEDIKNILYCWHVRSNLSRRLLRTSNEKRCFWAGFFCRLRRFYIVLKNSWLPTFAVISANIGVFNASPYRTTTGLK